MNYATRFFVLKELFPASELERERPWLSKGTIGLITKKEEVVKDMVLFNDSHLHLGTPEGSVPSFGEICWESVAFLYSFAAKERRKTAEKQSSAGVKK